VVVLVVGSAAPAQPVLDSARVAATVERVESRYRAPILAFYHHRAYRPVWTDTAALSDCGRALRMALADVDADGLDPLDYPTPAFSEGGSPESVEITFAEALLRVADDLARGRVVPDQVYDDWAVARRSLDYDWVLQRAASQGPEAALREVRPPHEEYARLRRALARYRALAEAGGWPEIPPGPVLRLGDEDGEVAAVPLLRERLRITGDLADTSSVGSLLRYDAALEQAVRRVQTRHGLVVDGIVGPATRAALNVTAAARAQQIALNMERWRWLTADFGPTHLHINAAGMWLDYVEDGERVERLRVIVGTRRTPTPGFSSRITHAVLNPYWYVPESIARAEIWPQVARDSGYLARHHMRVLPNGQIRQDPGPDNPLGPVKFIFENPFGVRLHGTSAPSLFDAAARAFSHGCIRVEEPLRVAERLLRSTSWDQDRIRAVLASDTEQWVALPTPVPLHVAYWTAWVEDDGTVQFRDDLYGRDRVLAAALGWTTAPTWSGSNLSSDQESRVEKAACAVVAP
jgi:murein L,D-transpeptidase YcbB/YkuD